MRTPNALIVTKRLSELCATKAMLNAAGFDVATTTKVLVAQALSRAVQFRAALVCRHSFTDQERQQIAAELQKSTPELAVVAKCPGCRSTTQLTDHSAIDAVKTACCQVTIRGKRGAPGRQLDCPTVSQVETSETL